MPSENPHSAIIAYIVFLFLHSQEEVVCPSGIHRSQDGSWYQGIFHLIRDLAA